MTAIVAASTDYIEFMAVYDRLHTPFVLFTTFKALDTHAYERELRTREFRSEKETLF